MWRGQWSPMMKSKYLTINKIQLLWSKNEPVTHWGPERTILRTPLYQPAVSSEHLVKDWNSKKKKKIQLFGNFYIWKRCLCGCWRIWKHYNSSIFSLILKQLESVSLVFSDSDIRNSVLSVYCLTLETRNGRDT